jgi:hypothetical protein
MGKITVVVTAALIGLMGGGCGASEGRGPAMAAQPLSTQGSGIGLFPGESMTFMVKLAGVEVGEASLAVGNTQETVDDKGVAHETIQVRSRIASSGAAALVITYLDDANTVIAVDSGRPLSFTTEVNQDKKSFVASAVFTDHNVTVLYRKPDDMLAGKPAPQPLTFDFHGQPVHDAHSAMAAFRLWRPSINETRTVWIIGGRRLWRIDANFVGQETIGTQLGNRNSNKLTGIAYRAKNDLSIDQSRPPRTFTVWLSQDADRVPLKVSATTEMGDIEILLSDYNRP